MRTSSPPRRVSNETSDHERRRPRELGPCEAHLSSFGRVIGLVVGAFGEWSEGLIATFDAIATLAAEKRWREMGVVVRVARASSRIIAPVRSVVISRIVVATVIVVIVVVIVIVIVILILILILKVIVIVIVNSYS